MEFWKFSKFQQKKESCENPYIRESKGEIDFHFKQRFSPKISATLAKLSSITFFHANIYILKKKSMITTYLNKEEILFI